MKLITIERPRVPNLRIRNHESLTTRHGVNQLNYYVRCKIYKRTFDVNVIVTEIILKVNICNIEILGFL